MNSIKSVKDYISNWWQENPSRRHNWRVLKDKIFAPIYWLSTIKGGVVLVLVFVGGMFIDSKLQTTPHDFELVSRACRQEEISARWDKLVSLSEDKYIAKVYFYCIER
jgi:hypothetical protein